MGKAEVKFKTQFNCIGEHFYSPIGEKIEMRHSPHMKEDGRRVLIKDKAVDTYNLIQSHREECEIENIIRRAVEGDYGILEKRHGQFMDITDAPQSLAEAQQFIIDTKREFEKLPKDIKAKFEYNPEIYIAMMSQDTEQWLDKTGLKEHYKKVDEAKKQTAITEANFQKVMSDLAQGETVKNGGEVNE